MQIRDIQKLLLQHGFDCGAIDNIFGEKTFLAIKRVIASTPPVVASQPHWLAVAREYIGEREIAGSRHNQKILDMWAKIESGITDDETAWCAAFVGAVLEMSEIRSTRAANARSYCKWGIPLVEPTYGCVVVFWRDNPQSWKGHVGFVVGKDENDNLMVLGGNQDDSVLIRAFDSSRVLAYRYPKNCQTPTFCGIESLPTLCSTNNLSENEA